MVPLSKIDIFATRNSKLDISNSKLEISSSKLEKYGKKHYFLDSYLENKTRNITFFDRNTNFLTRKTKNKTSKSLLLTPNNKNKTSNTPFPTPNNKNKTSNSPFQTPNNKIWQETRNKTKSKTLLLRSSFNFMKATWSPFFTS